MKLMMNSPTWNIGCIQACQCFHVMIPDTWVLCKDVDTFWFGLATWNLIWGFLTEDQVAKKYGWEAVYNCKAPHAP